MNVRTSTHARPASITAPGARLVALAMVVLFALTTLVGAAAPASARDARSIGVQRAPRDGGPARAVGPPQRGAAPDAAGEVVSFAVGSGAGEVGLITGEEVEPWGPSSFALDARGRVHVIDGANRRIVVADPSTGERSHITWQSPIVCPTDIALAGERIFVLDLAALPASVYEMDADGRAVASWDIPREHLDLGVTALDVTVDRKGAPAIRLELAGTWQAKLTGPGAGAQRIPCVLDGHVMRVPAASAASVAVERSAAGVGFFAEKDWATGRSAHITELRQGRPGATMRVASASPLGAVRFIDTDAQLNAYVFAEDLPGDGDRPRAFVKRYTRSGAPSGVAEIPLEAFAAHPYRPVRIAADGTIHVLVPSADRVRVVRLGISADTSEQLPDAVSAPASQPDAAARSTSAVTGTATARIADAFSAASMEAEADETGIAAWSPPDGNDRAWTYVNLSWYCSTSNYTTRNGSIRPRYLTAANKSYTSVPYCWGGFDTVTSFKTAMNSGLSAGDINCTGSKRAGTAGVDCSGFVSRLWGLGTKRSTWTLPNVAVKVSKTSMKLGDAYIWPGSHCMFFRYYTTGGAQVFESTTTNSYDRTVTMNRTNTALANYGAYRYVNWQ